MAEITSLGVHTPVALPYLIAEGILPKDPSNELYQWETYVFDEGHGDVEEELATTKTCVVWSQGKFIRDVYRFDLEGEDVIQAVLTTFPTPGSRGEEGKYRGEETSHRATKPTQSIPGQESSGKPSSSEQSRALVVFLKSKAHVYFLHGSNHIVDLPFEIAKAFPASRGVLLQRKTSPPPAPPSPQVPAAPPNSFFVSSQIHPSSSYLQSPTLAKSFGSSQPNRPSPLTGKSRLGPLFASVLGGRSEDEDEDVAALYSLADPLSDIGVVTYAIQRPKPRISSKNQPGLSIDLEPLDSGEEVVYVSPNDELLRRSEERQGSFILIVTANKDLRTLTVWHAWYTEEKSLASLLKQRAAHRAAKAKRRSSFMSATIGTGTATPAVRPRDGARESLAGAVSGVQPGEPIPSQPAAPTSRKPTRQEEEDAMASQMDPDYQPGASQQATRESRRISSLNADMRQTQPNANASFAAGGGRRNTSFGGPNERRSFGHRKSRGSTPGSVFSRSLGPDDDLMEVDGSFDADDEESVGSIVRHIRATFDAVGAESIFAGAGDDMKRELVVRKLHSLPIASPGNSPNRGGDGIRVATLQDAQPRRGSNDQFVNVYIHQSYTKETTCLRLLVKQRLLWPDISQAQLVAIPLVAGETKISQCNHITKVKDRQYAAMLLVNRGLIMSVNDQELWHLPKQAFYRMYDHRDQYSTSANADKDIGKSRTLQLPSGVVAVLNAGAYGRFDECDHDQVYHRRQIRLGPRSAFVSKTLETCQLVLPDQQARSVLGVWWMAYAELTEHPEKMIGTASDVETVALIAAVLTFLMHMLDEKARAALNLSRVAIGKVSQVGNLQFRRSQQEQAFSRDPGLDWVDTNRPASRSSVLSSSVSRQRSDAPDQLMVLAATLANELIQSERLARTTDRPFRLSASDAVKLLLSLHIAREEQKLCRLASSRTDNVVMAALIAQIGSLLGLFTWSYHPGQYYELEGASEEKWAFVKSRPGQPPQMALMDEPVGAFHWFEHAMTVRSGERYPTLDVIAMLDTPGTISQRFRDAAVGATERIAILSDVLEATSGLTATPTRTVELMAKHGITSELMESLPEAIAAPFRDAILKCGKEPPTSWSHDLLTLVGREDLATDANELSTSVSRTPIATPSSPRDAQTVCNAVEHQSLSTKTKEESRHAVSQLIFNEDRRLVEAMSLMHFNVTQTAECIRQPDWADPQYFKQEDKMLALATVRMLALPPGDAMIHFDCQTPLLTDKYLSPGFANSCIMQPIGRSRNIDRSSLTEDRVSWAYFHAGASTGLRISRQVTGIDTSWIAFNKPNDLTNRHAGLLLALGLNGHLRHLAKWLSFKYLTPKHTMTSVGLLLGLSASYMGSMDSLITRMLSVHITRMLPTGAAELNVSPLTQTAGLIGIGLLYYNTQHRRMSEIMLSEVEHMEMEDPDSGPDPLRDECYRLAAGFALGYINLGKGRDLRGLHGMYLPKRLLAIAVGPRPVGAVHVFDRATAGAVVALALVYMKSGDESIARKIDIPDTPAQFDHVRPDILLLRAMAKHVIMWNTIVSGFGQSGFVRNNLPTCYRGRIGIANTAAKHQLESADVPFYNIVTGLGWALSLKYAGSGDTTARDEILEVLDYFYTVRSGADAYYYDAKLARSTVRRCIDVLALAAATVMAGTGDLKTFRYLRRLHGRTDTETQYGSHLAAHLAIGVLFLGGGTYTFQTSNLAIASLICAFYPLFPTDVHDNRVHLQALRHFWVFAAEARCLVVEEIDTQRPISIAILVTTKDGSTKSLTAPCLLPELDTISNVQTNDPAYWRVTLDFEGNPEHLSAFRKNQRIIVRHCPATEAHDSAFSSTLAALNPNQLVSQPGDRQIGRRNHLTGLAVFKDLDQADMELILPPKLNSATHTDERGTVVDDRMAMGLDADGSDSDALWNLRVLFAWAEKARDGEEGALRWLGDEVVEELRAKIEERTRKVN